MLSRKQITEASTEVVRREYQRARDLSFDLKRSYSWTEYIRALRKEFTKRKGNNYGS